MLALLKYAIGDFKEWELSFVFLREFGVVLGFAHCSSILDGP